MELFTEKELNVIQGKWQKITYAGPLLVEDMERVFEHAREYLRFVATACKPTLTIGAPERKPRESRIYVEVQEGHARRCIDEQEAAGFELISIQTRRDENLMALLDLHFRKP